MIPHPLQHTVKRKNDLSRVSLGLVYALQLPNFSVAYHSYCFLKNLPQYYLDRTYTCRLKLLVSIDLFLKFNSIASLVQLQPICNMFSCSVFDISQVISGYREAEKSSWHSEVSLSVVHRIREVTFCCCVTTFNITGSRLLSFDAFVLEISLGLPSILQYRWTFQSDRQFIVGSLTFTGLWIAYNGRQGEQITAITQEQRLNSKIQPVKAFCSIEFYLHAKFYCLLCGGYRDLLRNYRTSHTHTRRLPYASGGLCPAVA